MQQVLGYYIVTDQEGVEHYVFLSQEIRKNARNTIVDVRKVFTLNAPDGEEVRWLAAENVFTQGDGTRFKKRRGVLATGHTAPARQNRG